VTTERAKEPLKILEKEFIDTINNVANLSEERYHTEQDAGVPPTACKSILVDRQAIAFVAAITEGLRAFLLNFGHKASYVSRAQC